jgi:integrase
MDDDIAKMLLFLIYTGLRASEYCEMEIDDGIIHVKNSKTAAGIRDIPLSDKAHKLAHIPLYDKYFHMKYHFTVFREKYGFDHTLHDTRHTCVSLLANAGVDKRIIQAIVGHQGKDVTDKVYTHINLEVMKEALDKI